MVVVVEIIVPTTITYSLPPSMSSYLCREICKPWEKVPCLLMDRKTKHLSSLYSFSTFARNHTDLSPGLYNCSGLKKRLSAHHFSYNWHIIAWSFTHLLLLFASESHIADMVALPEGVHSVSIQQLDGPDQPGTGAAVVQVAVWVAVVNMGADEALLVAQQDHDLEHRHH